jgi:tubulysin polyketide synthase-like protein
MNAHTLLENLKQRGIQLEFDGSEIHCRGITEPITPELVETLKRYKQEIIAFLSDSDPRLSLELELAGLTEKWRNYLLQRVEILIQYEGYSVEAAHVEVKKMILHYQGLN